MLKATMQDLEEGKLVITFDENSESRISFVERDYAQTIVREDGKWRFVGIEGEPLGQDCSSLDMDFDEE